MRTTTSLTTQQSLQTKLKGLKTVADLSSFLNELIAPTVQAVLEAQMTKIQTEVSPIDVPLLAPPRRGRPPRIKPNIVHTIDTYAEQQQKALQPLTIRMYETIDDAMEEKVVALYAKGMTTRDIQIYMQDIYRMQLAPETVSSITDKVLPLVKEWQVRPLSRMYPILYLDGVHFKVRDAGKIVNKCAYIMLGVSDDGHKEVLGIWVGAAEGAKFWMQILNEIKNRGVEEALICCIDGLKGFSDAINAIFPEATIQQCIVHQIRHTMKYVPHRHKKQFCDDLRKIYTAPTEEAGLQALEEVKKAWPQYLLYLRSWETKWPELVTFFGYPKQLRRIIYTNNAIENLNRQFRKVTKTSQVFPHDDALLKLLWLAQHDIARKWTSAIHNWGEIMTQLGILFPEKILL
jgi:putative transposase